MFTAASKTKPEVIFVIGGPGSGKGTQCQLLQKQPGYYHISTGELIRDLVKNTVVENNPRLNEIREKVQEGELLDDQMITDVLRAEMQRHPEAKHFLIDGYPRTLGQLRLFETTVQPCDKVLFLDAAEAVMQSRLLARANTEHREDDNAKAIAHRIETYYKKTLPVIESLKQEKKFIRVDSSGTIEETAAHIQQALPCNNMQTVNLIEFLASYLKSGNFYDAIETLEDRYHTTDFKIALAFATFFYVIQNKEDVTKVLNAKTVAGFQNYNFDVSHGHMLNINAVPAFVDGNVNPIWQNLHKGILHSVGNSQSIRKLVAKHFHKFLEKTSFSLDIAFESFIESFWCEFMFGKKADAHKFHQLRAKLMLALKYSYYDSRIKNIPVIGTQACKLYSFLEKNKFAEIDNELREFINNADDCLIARFQQELSTSPEFKENVNTAVLDNAFVLILALDFIQNAMYETLAKVIKSGLKTPEERKAVYTEGLHEAFLFPYRTRVPQEKVVLQNATIAAGTPVYINLLKSGLYHSAGPRMCAGFGVTQWIKEAIWDQLEDIEFDLLATSFPADREKLSHSKDVPISPERYEVSWHYSRDYLQKVLPHHPFKQVNEFFDVLKIYENPFLSHYITSTFIQAIEKLQIDKSTLCIATPELRGIPAAAAVAEALHVPLVIVRKEGKTPGPIVSKKYVNAYSEEVIELSKTADVKDKNVILIDDGIASGGTTVSCCELIKELGGNVSLILAMINHTYKQKVDNLNQYPIQTLFDFAKTAPIPSVQGRRNNGFFKPAPNVANDPVSNVISKMAIKV